MKFINKSKEDRDILAALDSILTRKRNFIYRMPRRNDSVVLLLSGGLDSVCLWNVLMGKYELNVYPLYVYNPEKRNVGQERSIRYFSKVFKSKYPQLFHDVYWCEQKFIFSFQRVVDPYSVLNDIPNILNNLIYSKKFRGNFPNLTGAPSRIGIYTLKAFEYANLIHYKNGFRVDTIVWGIVPEDGKLLRDSTLSVLRSINLFLCTILSNYEWQVTAPIDKTNNFYYTKSDLVTYALKSSLKIEETWSCNNQKIIHCGACFNCISRKIALAKNNINDKTLYLKLPSFQSILKKISRLIYSFTVVHNPKLATNSMLKTKSAFVCSPELVYSVNKKVVYQTTKEGGVILLNPETGSMQEFNETAYMIWKYLLKKEQSFAQLLHYMSQIFNIDRKALQGDVSKFIELSVKRGYLHYHAN